MNVGSKTQRSLPSDSDRDDESVAGPSEPVKINRNPRVKGQLPTCHLRVFKKKRYLDQKDTLKR